jgi:hypothetical protein
MGFRRPHRTLSRPSLLPLVALLAAGCAAGTAGTPGAAGTTGAAAMGDPASAADGWTALFNGRDLSGWKVPEGDNGHWKVVDGVIDYDALSEAPGEKDLWTERRFQNFVLRVEWRAKRYAGRYPMPTVLPDGSEQTDAAGKVILSERPNFDSGVYLRGSSKSQVNFWGWPIGSGEVYGYRTDRSMPAEVRAGVTPKVAADRPVGEWNRTEITMRGERLTVVLNGQTVIENAQLPGVPAAGPIGLQHHGGRNPDGTLNAASSLMQFRDLSIRELP